MNSQSADRFCGAAKPEEEWAGGDNDTFVLRRKAQVGPQYIIDKVFRLSGLGDNSFEFCGRLIGVQMLLVDRQVREKRKAIAIATERNSQTSTFE